MPHIVQVDDYNEQLSFKVSTARLNQNSPASLTCVKMVCYTQITILTLFSTSDMDCTALLSAVSSDVFFPSLLPSFFYQIFRLTFRHISPYNAFHFPLLPVPFPTLSSAFSLLLSLPSPFLIFYLLSALHVHLPFHSPLPFPFSCPHSLSVSLRVITSSHSATKTVQESYLKCLKYCTVPM